MKRDPSIADSIEARIQARRAETERGESDGGERKREREEEKGGSGRSKTLPALGVH